MLQSTEFWSAIVGAVVGGAMAFLAQWIAIYEQRQQRAEDLLKTKQSLAIALLLKLMRIHSNFCQMNEHIETSIAEAARHGIEGELWQAVVPLASVPDQVVYAPEEMSLLLTLGDLDIFNLVVDLDVRHNSLIEALRTMSALRLALNEHLTEFVSLEMTSGPRLGASPTSEQMRKVRPKMIELNSLIDGVRALSKENAAASEEAMTRISSLLKNKLDVAYRAEPKPR